MEQPFTYPINIEIDEAGYHLVTFPDFPEAATDGTTLAEALEEASDCLEEAIAGRIRRKDPIPPPSPSGTNQKNLPVPAQMSAKAALYLALKNSELSKSELASRLGCDEKEVRRLLDPRHPSKLPRIESALAVLGKRLVLSIQEAA
ncbi:MAG: type II toxin-antitoxin system HicB family antitoxin [Magnetococcales bacterium]|nr:type II toxin-antitoxin system HicB family antitoxin [Magnetococcales bacterium]